MDARTPHPIPAFINKSTNDRSIVQVPPALRLTYQAASRLSPHLGAAMARQLMFRPMRTRYREEQSAVLATARKATLEVRGRRVQVYCWGEGPLVLLMHGWGGHAGQMTEFVALLVKAGYRVMAIDGPAHGRSAGRLSSVVHFADAIEAASATFGPIHSVIAHSMGATATTLALSKGLSVHSAVFVAPQARISGYWQLARSALGMSDEVWEIMRRGTERWLKVRYDQLHPVNLAPQLTTPLLILHGTGDRMTPLSEGEKLAAAWPGAVLRPIECGHIAILRDWHALLAAVDFVKAHSRAS